VRTKIKFIGFTLAAICLLLIAVGFFFRKKIASHYIPEVEQVGVIHIHLKNDTSYIQLQLAVKNQSFLRIQFDTLTYEISLFNKTYLQKQHFLGIVLPGHGYDTLHASIKIPYVAILQDLAQERGKRDSTNYAVQLFLQYSTWFGKSEIDIHRSAKLKIPAVPEFEITDIKWTKVRLKSIQAAVSLKLTNHSDIALAIHDFKYVMEFLEQGNITGVHNETILIKPKAETFVTIPVVITPTQLVETAFSVMTNHDQYGYNLKVNATLESVDSVGNRFQIELIKNGVMELKKQSTKTRVASR
jgi:LEA14-like dessication related protein